MKKGVALFFTVAFILTALMDGFQEELVPHKHEVEVRLVLVDVIVSKEGKFVLDLKKDDFEIYEDRKRVPINSFELMSFEQERELKAPEEKTEEKLSAPRGKKLIVLFDGVNSWEKELKSGMEKISNELVSLIKLGNEVMILCLNEKKGLEILQPFTTQEELIRKAVSQASGSVWRPGEDLMRLNDFAAMLMGETVDILVKSQLKAYLLMLRRKFEATLGGILATLNMVKTLPGRKSILFISSGIPDISTPRSVEIDYYDISLRSSRKRAVEVNPLVYFGKVRVFDPFHILEKKDFSSGDKALKEIIRFANSHNISFYSLDPDAFSRALFSGDMAEYVAEEDATLFTKLGREKIWGLQNLKWISEETGAVSLRGGRKYQEFRRIMSADLNSYYQLSFYPRRKKADSRYHEIKVRVNRRDVDLRWRKGYTDYSEEEFNKIFVLSVFYNPSLFKRLPFQAELIPFYADSGKYELWLSLDLPTKEFFLDRTRELVPKTYRLYIWTTERREGEKAFEGALPIPLNISPSFIDQIKSLDSLTLHFKGSEFESRHKEYQATLALLDPQTNEVGTVEASFSLSDFKKNEEALINCVLGSLNVNLNTREEFFSLSEEDGSLEYGEIKFFPKVRRDFSKEEDMAIFIQIYLPKKKIEIQPEFEVSGQGIKAKRLEGELVAESWNEKFRVWGGIFKLEAKALQGEDILLKIKIPVSEEDLVLSKEVKLTKRSP